jgi:hypothetical protein
MYWLVFSSTSHLLFSDCLPFQQQRLLLLSDKGNEVNYCQSVQASKHPELLLKEFIDRGDLAIYWDGEKAFKTL